MKKNLIIYYQVFALLIEDWIDNNGNANMKVDVSGLPFNPE